MPEARPEPVAGEERIRTFWCRVYRCPSHAPRESAGLPLGWLRVQLGVRDGKSHWMTFCSPACLQETLQQHPQEFTFNAAIDRKRIETAKRRKQRTGAPGSR